MNRRYRIKQLLLTGLLAGTLDGLAAVILYYMQTGKDPLNVFRFIASGVFGVQAFSGGVTMALWGIVFHYSIAFGWAMLFFLLARKCLLLTKNWIISGVVYGVFVWLIMNLVVVPLSHVPVKADPKEWPDILTGVSILVICIGLPVSFAARKHHPAGA
ncbi:MAG TPA: hypothetical protein VFM90_10535 [Cyclobacteriaceae bacterium]|nr:hypothetical protein [Cyclobacteriaceae bacterium]